MGVSGNKNGKLWGSGRLREQGRKEDRDCLYKVVDSSVSGVKVERGVCRRETRTAKNSTFPK